MVDVSSARAYNSWWQFRSDAWSRLEEASERLANASRRGQPTDTMAETASELLDALAPIEQYWAFPGPEAYRRTRELFVAASYDGFARMVARINRALVTESYRTGSGRSLVDGGQEKAEPGQVNAEQEVPSRPSTSPNYQILASLDLGRRQAALEGFGLVQRQLEYAMWLRDAIDSHPLLAKYMHCLSTAELIPAEFRASGLDQPLRGGLDNMAKAWDDDEFVLDPSRISLYIGATGIDGATFKREQLMDKFGIQVNKTSRNTVLFMTSIGTTRSSVAYLIEVLVRIVRDLDHSVREMSPTQQTAHARAVLRQTSPCAPLPDFGGFHAAFTGGGDHPTAEGDVRRAFFLSYDDAKCEYLLPDEVEQRMNAGQRVVSATFVTPYPPRRCCE